jgi:hypothetical protein
MAWLPKIALSAKEDTLPLEQCELREKNASWWVRRVFGLSSEHPNWILGLLEEI